MTLAPIPTCHRRLLLPPPPLVAEGFGGGGVEEAEEEEEEENFRVVEERVVDRAGVAATDEWCWKDFVDDGR